MATLVANRWQLAHYLWRKTLKVSAETGKSQRKTHTNVKKNLYISSVFCFWVFHNSQEVKTLRRSHLDRERFTWTHNDRWRTHTAVCRGRSKKEEKNCWKWTKKIEKNFQFSCQFSCLQLVSMSVQQRCYIVKLETIS